MQNPFTRCANGSITDGGIAHEFEAWPQMYGEREPSEPLLFCRRCGEVRELRLAPREPSMRLSSLDITSIPGGAAPVTED